MVVNSEQGTGEGEDFTEGNQDGVVDLTGWGQDESGNQKATAQGNEGDRRKELDLGFPLFYIHELWCSVYCLWCIGECVGLIVYGLLLGL